ncbi:hydrogenase expression/formation protein [Polaromonas sp.]|uniref:hydrogenase expression/formation protein n=1 Tax=Polaromonas sp. TaxID=1869339 RepID=UPI0013B85A11|nr:hydrogenase expression/formation protein [Polaromonas sp.]NDP64196.1 hydrogenase expression/formation protein [Polaromonas sp.]
MKDFPIPVRTIGPGSQAEEDVLDYMPMPQGMETFRAPILPELDEVVSLVRGCAALREALVQLGDAVQTGENRSVSLDGLPQADLKLINTVLGEGEVSALVSRAGDNSFELRVQESVFAGVWRVVQTVGGRVVSDILELGYVPQALKDTARQDIWEAVPRWQGALPPNVQNAPLLLSEIEDQWKQWQPGQAAYVVNLTLLPMSVEDIGFMDHHLGTGRVLILSRGYGNCRITNTCMPNTWRVVYYNSQDLVILNTVEVTELPDVAQAAKEDLEDSYERLKEVLEWVESA